MHKRCTPLIDGTETWWSQASLFNLFIFYSLISHVTYTEIELYTFLQKPLSSNRHLGRCTVGVFHELMVHRHNGVSLIIHFSFK